MFRTKDCEYHFYRSRFNVRNIGQVLLWIWQLPQNLLALILMYTICRETYVKYLDMKIYQLFIFRNPKLSSCALGGYIFTDRYFTDTKTLRHEIGHIRQSKMLGWFYLPLIGLPSVIGNVLHRYMKFDYYKLLWEAWADKLGGVVR